MKKVVLITMSLVVLLLLNKGVLAKSFGVVGEVFPVLEKSLLVLIEERLNQLTESGGIEALQRHVVARVIDVANRPKPLNIARATQKSTHFYLPEVLLKQAIEDGAGRIIYPQGTRVNALEKLPFYTPCWLFLNGDDLAQINWARQAMQTCLEPKIILTGGAIKAAEEALNAIIYFDQSGKLSQQLKLKAVPAKVTRVGNTLRIEELVIKGSGDEI